jgi:hypothetical protein
VPLPILKDSPELVRKIDDLADV